MMDDDIFHLTDGERYALSTITRACGALSLLGNSVIVHGCLAKGWRNWTTYHRIMLLMAITDSIVCVWYMVAGAAIPPKGQATSPLCSTQAFFQQVGIVVPLLNATLATNYLLILKFQWSPERLAKLEKWIYLSIFSFAFAVAVAPIVMDLYHDAVIWCWIASYPPGCDSPYSSQACVSGQGAATFQLAFFYGPLWASIFYTVAVMLVVVSVVRETDKLLWRLEAQSRDSLTMRLVLQASFYCIAFLLTWTFVSALRLSTHLNTHFNMVLAGFASAFVLLQGFLNMLVFLYPRIATALSLKSWSFSQKVAFVFSLRELDPLVGCSSQHSFSETRSEDKQLDQT